MPSTRNARYIDVLALPDVPRTFVSALLAALSTLVGVIFGLTGNGIWMATVIVAAGLFFSLVMIVAYFGANDFGGERRKTESTTWVNTSHNVGPLPVAR